MTVISRQIKMINAGTLETNKAAAGSQLLAENKTKILALVFLGNLLESYDYSIYGMFAVTIAAKFFSNDNAASAMLLTYIVFAVGFITRPLGSAVLGSLGDRLGRKKMLLVSILLMAIPTAVSGLLPTYAQIGITAGVLLTLCRLLQGFAVGAEFTGTIVYATEYVKEKQQNFFGSLCISSGYSAMLLASGILFCISHFLTAEQLNNWGWRIPFLLGILLGFLGFYLRNKLPETPAFTALRKRGAVKNSPLMDTLRDRPLQVLTTIGTSVLHVCSFYLLFIYFNGYLIKYLHQSESTVALSNFLTTCLTILALPLFGWAATYYKREYFIYISCIGLLIFSYPLFYLLTHNPNFYTCLLTQSVLALLAATSSAVLPGFMTNQFSTAYRFTGVAVAYNISAVLFGGTSPLMLTYLMEKIACLETPSFYLMAAALITLSSAIIANRHRTNIQ